MRATLHHILQTFRHLDGLVIGYETTHRMRWGERWRFRYLRVGQNSEMEIGLPHGKLFKSRNGHGRLYKQQKEEA